MTPRRNTHRGSGQHLK